MKIKSNFKLREIVGEIIIVNQGAPSVNMTRIISLNESARLLFENLQAREFSISDAADVLVANYDIDLAQAEKDAAAWVDSLKNCGVIE